MESLKQRSTSRFSPLISRLGKLSETFNTLRYILELPRHSFADEFQGDLSPAISWTGGGIVHDGILIFHVKRGFKRDEKERMRKAVSVGFIN